MLYFKISSSGMPVKCFTIALREFPCATTTTFLLSRIAGQMVSCQNGRTLSTVIARDSVVGKASVGRL